MDVQSIGARFAAFVREHRTWQDLPANTEALLLETVQAAGFRAWAVMPGKLSGRYSDSGEQYLINDVVPFKVLAEDGTHHYMATGWLEAVAKIAIGASPLDVAIKSVVHEIKRSIPMAPVQLTVEGDFLEEYPSDSRGYLKDHGKDTDKLTTCVGIHMYCGSFMDRKRATSSHDAICCRGCHIRVLFPLEVETYGQLRAALSEKLSRPV